jgi:hypothetical protein
MPVSEYMSLATQESLVALLCYDEQHGKLVDDSGGET